MKPAFVHVRQGNVDLYTLKIGEENLSIAFVDGSDEVQVAIHGAKQLPHCPTPTHASVGIVLAHDEGEALAEILRRVR
jgi:hypothetical protein